MSKIIGKISAALLSVIIIITCFMFAGCRGMLAVKVSDVAFSSSGKTITSLDMRLKERVKLNSYVTVMPSNARNKAFSAVSSDESIVSVETQTNGGVVPTVYVTAENIGTATLTVTTAENAKTATLTVKVGYAEPDGIEIVTPEGFKVIRDTVIVNESEMREIEFTAKLGDSVDPTTPVEWLSRGDTQAAMSDTTLANEAFAFLPVGAGRTEVSATVYDELEKKYTDSVYINVYGEITDVTYSVSGNKQQTAGYYSNVSFEILYDLPQGNPEPIFEWLVNGEDMGSGAKFGYMPSAPGMYLVEGFINGEAVCQERIYVKGVIIPKNVWVDYDNCYPEVFIRWDSVSAAAGFQVEIINLETGRSVNNDLTTENTAIKDKFTDSSFNATAYMTGSADMFNTRFRVRVKTLADDNDIISESEYSASYTTEKVPERAKSYLAAKFYDGARNLYVKSYDEFYEWFEYAMLWRPAEATDGTKLYLDYDFTSAMDVISRAIDEQHFTGSYQYSGTTPNGNYPKECTFKIIFETDGAPTAKTDAVGHDGEAWNALRPHVNYDESKARPSRYVFPIDYKTPVTVETSDQLYYAVQLGYKPVPISGSAAERLYNYARRTLRYIITDDMTDVEKLHAIYDWIMWRVIYDSEVLKYTDISAAVKYESYYLESVFTDVDYYGVCDAMSKAFVLMSGIEGFESVRVTGIAGSSANSRGGHAWNKVKLNGKWYVVDCTWGDASVQIIANGSWRESANHMYFLLSDSDVADTHIEDENGRFPATASVRYPWYEEDIKYNGSAADFYLESGLTTLGFNNAVKSIAKFMSENINSAQSVFTVGPDSVNTFSSNYYCYEIIADSKWGTWQAVNRPLYSSFTDAMNSCGLRYGADYRVVSSEVGGMSHLLVFMNI